VRVNNILVDPPAAGIQQRAPDHPSLRRAVLGALLSAVCLFGLFTSFHYHYAAWGIDPDTVQTAVVWQNVKLHGLGFLRSWWFGSDNWLLTLIAPAGLLYDMVGTPPTLVIGLGWTIFLGNIALTATAGAILGGRMVGLALAAFLLVAGQDTLGLAGFMSHPASHNVSLLWGLLALLCMERWLRGGTWPWLAAAGVTLGADCVSDPWALMGFAAPLVLATGFVAVTGRFRRRALFGLTVSLAAIVAGLTHGFGLLGFLPRFPLEVADIPTFDANAAWLARCIGVLFNPLPGLRQPLVVTTAGVCLILAAILVRSAAALAHGLRKRADAEQFLLMGIVLSVVLPAAAFLISRLPLSINVGRFMPTLVVFAPLLVFVALRRCWLRLPLWLRLGGPVFFGLIAIAGPASNPAAWLQAERAPTIQDIPRLTAFLEAQGLTYGYGTYFGSLSNAVTWMSNGAVAIRPIVFAADTGFVSGQRGQSSALWFRPSDAPAGQKLFFVAFWAYDDQCADRQRCVTAPQRQFGPALRIEQFDDLTILVWDHPLEVKADF
jgi:hypothetical protein